jgi:rhodanese-related sulfurtransferase
MDHNVATEVTKITVDDAKGRMDRSEPIVFVDSRNPVAWGESDVKLPGAVRIPADQVRSHISELPKDRAIVTYCT